MKGVTCIDCHWCASNDATGNTMCCCNRKSENYNQLFSEEEAKIREFDCAETEREYDYHSLTAWQFASKYYM